MKIELVRSGACPSCGAPIQFASNSAAAQVCKSCNFVVARTDRDLRAVGRVADLVPIASPLTVGAMGKLGNAMFRVAGRMQYDRANAPGAPWQEFYLELDGGARWAWLALAQGNWYLMSLYEHSLHLPTYQQAQPGVSITLGGGEVFTVAERSARRPISGEGELPFPFEPGVVEYYADMSGPQGAFGTLDFGTGNPPEPPQVYFGRQIDPRTISLDGSGPVGDGPKAEVTSLKCPGCGGDLPLAEPDRSERVVCRYCGTQSDVNAGALIALKKLPMPPVQPAIALGAKGTLRGQEVTVVGFMVRGTSVVDEDGDVERFSWREYLLYSHGAAATAPGHPAAPGAAAGPGFLFLVEEDGSWEHIVPIGMGDLGRPSADVRTFQNQTFRHTETVEADVEAVLGEFYWKVEVGERVQASTFSGPSRTKISEESTGQEISCSYSSPLQLPELRHAFGTQFQSAAAPGGPRPNVGWKHHLFWIGMLVLWLAVSVSACARSHQAKVLTTQVPSKSSLTKSLEKTLKDSLDLSKKNARLLADGGVKTADLRIGAVTTKPTSFETASVIEGVKPRIARCFPGVVTGSFTVNVTMGQKGLVKTAEATAVQGLAAAPVSCARVSFLSTQWSGAPAGATVTIPIQFTPVADAVAPATSTPPAGAEPDTAAFSDPFDVLADGRNMKITLSAQNLSNTWVGIEVALVHEATGTVWEDLVELDYYSGVEGGESWSEGSRSKTLWYSRMPAGKYVLRVDPATDAAKPAQGPIGVEVTSDVPPAGYVIIALFGISILYMLSTFLRKARLAADAARAASAAQGRPA